MGKTLLCDFAIETTAVVCLQIVTVDSLSLSDKRLWGERYMPWETDTWMMFLLQGYGQCCVGVHVCDLRWGG